MQRPKATLSAKTEGDGDAGKQVLWLVLGGRGGRDAKQTDSVVGNKLMARGGGEELRQRKCDATVDSCGGDDE